MRGRSVTHGLLGSERGLTLAEVCVSVFLLVTITLSLLHTNLSARHLMSTARVQLEATNVLQSYLEQLKSGSYVGMVDASYPGIVISNAGTAAAGDDLLGTVTIDVTDNGNDTKTILGTAQWTQRRLNQNVTKNISLMTLVSEP